MESIKDSVLRSEKKDLGGNEDLVEKIGDCEVRLSDSQSKFGFCELNITGADKPLVIEPAFSNTAFNVAKELVGQGLKADGIYKVIEIIKNKK
jgi:hypothetical protein